MDNNQPPQPKQAPQSKEDILNLQYEDWIRHPLTQHLMVRLTARAAFTTNRLIGLSTDFEADDKQLRVYSYGIKTISTILADIKDRNRLILNEKE